MNKRCSVCNHACRADIDRALIDGMRLRPLAARYGLSPSSAATPGPPRNPFPSAIYPLICQSESENWGNPD